MTELRVRTRPTLLLFCALLLAGNSVLFWLADRNANIDWPSNAIRNWQDHGFLKFGGKLVVNPGGVGLPENPSVYPGHSPYSLYPKFWIEAVLGVQAGTVVFYLLLSILAFGSAAYLFGQDERAYLISGLTVLMPGFVIWSKVADPNTTVALLGFPYVAVMWRKLRQPEVRAIDFVGLFILSAIFTVLNWTSALVHGTFFFFLVAQRVPFKRLVQYVAIVAVAMLPVAVTSIRSRIGGGGGGSEGLMAFLDAYAWGRGGYAEGSSAAVLLVRYGFINVLALAGIWLVLAVTWVGRARVEFTKAALALVPAIVALLETLVLRNYFCHHPWMGSPFLLLGATLSIAMLLELPSKGFDFGRYFSLQKPFSWASAVAAFCFGLLIIETFRANRPDFRMRELVHEVTARNQLLIVPQEVNPNIAHNPVRLAYFLDRAVEPVPTLVEAQATKARGVVLSMQELTNGWELVGKSSAELGPTERLVQVPLKWFRERIARRASKSRVPQVRTYYVYRRAVASDAKEFTGTSPKE